MNKAADWVASFVVQHFDGALWDDVSFLQISFFFFNFWDVLVLVLYELFVISKKRETFRLKKVFSMFLVFGLG